MKRLWRKFRKKPYYKLVIIILLILLVSPFAYAVSRYVLDIVNDYYLASKNFYFNSNRLKEENPLYSINNWSGVGNFDIEISVNSNKNYLLGSETDVVYTVSYTCPVDVICSSSKAGGTIYQSTGTDNFNISITPTRMFDDGETVNIHVSAVSVSPYVKEISADFMITVGKRGLSYTIDDTVNSPYLLVNITNALTYYTVKEAFSSYQIGDQIDSTVYKALSPINKAKCISALITLEFDPTVIVLDTTSSLLNIATYNDVVINGVNYIDEITFPIDAMSSQDVRFYKINATMDYTYPVQNVTPVVIFSVE